MEIEVRSIDSADERIDRIVSGPGLSEDPWNDSGRLTIAVGVAGEAGADMFSVVVSTPSARQQHVDERGEFRGILVDRFDRESIRAAVSEFVESAHHDYWWGCVEKLQSSMDWEYEGYK